MKIFVWFTVFGILSAFSVFLYVNTAEISKERYVELSNLSYKNKLFLKKCKEFNRDNKITISEYNDLKYIYINQKEPIATFDFFKNSIIKIKKRYIK